MPRRFQALAILVAAIWGSNFVLIKQGLDELPPMLFVGLRYFFCALPLIFLLPRPKVSLFKTALYGLFIGCGQFGLLFWAIESSISPGLASLVVQLQVFMTILLATILMGESLRPLQVMALIISLAGLVLIAVYTDGSATVLGLLLTLLAAAFWAGGNLIIKQIGSVNIVAFLAWSSLFAAPPLLLLAVWLDGWQSSAQAIRSATIGTWLIVAWQTIGNTLIGYGLWNWLLDRYPASAVAPWALLVPVFGMTTSWLVLGESLPWWKLLAAALILSGLLINLYAMRKPRVVIPVAER